jgi:hypothetical protein
MSNGEARKLTNELGSISDPVTGWVGLTLDWQGTVLLSQGIQEQEGGVKLIHSFNKCLFRTYHMPTLCHTKKPNKNLPLYSVHSMSGDRK